MVLRRQRRRDVAHLRGVGEAEPFEEQGVGGNEEAGAGHGRGGPFGAEDSAEGGFEEAGGDWGSDRAVAGGPTEVPSHPADRAPSDAHGDRDVQGVGAHEHDIDGLDGHVGACADDDTQVGLGEDGGVVDPVAEYADLLACSREFGDFAGSVFWEDFGDDAVSMPSWAAMRSAVA